MRSLTDNVVVIDDGACVNHRHLAHQRLGSDDCTRHHDRSIQHAGRRRDEGCGVHDGRERKLEIAEFLAEPLA